MFGSSKTSTFKPVPFGQQRRRKGVPRWVWLLLTGIAIGVAGLYYVEQRVLPPRLSLPESLSMRENLEQATKSRDEMAQQLAQATAQMKTAQGERRVATEKMQQALNNVEPLKKDLDLLLKAVPPDPRGNPIAIRAGVFTTAGGKLNYHVLFTRERSSDPNFTGLAQLTVTGGKGGRDTTIALEPQAITVPGYQHYSGSMPLPEGLVPREVTVKLLKSAGGAMVSMRVFRL
jgi:hypothetical protein